MTESFIKDFNTRSEAPAVQLRFVRVKFPSGSREYTYRVDPEASVSVGQYGITRKNMSKVLIIAIDVPPVPNLDVSKYDFIDPIARDDDEEERE